MRFKTKWAHSFYNNICNNYSVRLVMWNEIAGLSFRYFVCIYDEVGEKHLNSMCNHNMNTSIPHILMCVCVCVQVLNKRKFLSTETYHIFTPSTYSLRLMQCNVQCGNTLYWILCMCVCVCNIKGLSVKWKHSQHENVWKNGSIYPTAFFCNLSEAAYLAWAT